MIAKHQSGFSQKNCDIFTQMLYVDALRGWDATGVFGVSKVGNVDIKKQAAAAGHFVSSEPYKKFISDGFAKYQMMIGHNRKATHGEKRHADAHPFWDKAEKIVLVHNGMVSNHKDLCKESTVDSAAVANAIAAGDNMDEVLASIQGAFAFIFYNTEEKKLYMIRNNLRPLYVSENAGAYIISSEDSMAYWICKRNTEYITKNTELKPWFLYSIDLDKREFKEEREITPKKQIYPVVTEGHPSVITGLRITPTAKTTTGTDVIEQVSSFYQPAEDTFFLNNGDLTDIEDVKRFIKHGDTVLVQTLSFELLGTSTYKVECQLVNVERAFVEVMLFMPKAQFGPMDMSKVLEVTVDNMVVKDRVIVLYCSNPIEDDCIETKNGVVISERMWMDQRFPIDCDICGERIKWETLPKSEILISKQTDFIIICPRCTGDHRHG